MTKYVLAGGTSELGNRVVQQLARTVGPQDITCLVRPSSFKEPLIRAGVVLETGDVTEPDSFAHLLSRDTTYIDMTHPKHYHVSLGVVTRAGVRRAFFITTTGVFSKYNYCSDIYKENEARIRASGIAYTIVRPALIYGTERDRNMTKLLRVLSRLPVFPVFGDGRSLMQPVHVQDLADGIVTAILNPEVSLGKEYNLCGPSAISYLKLLGLAARALGRRVWFFRIPHSLAVIAVGLGEHLPGFPIKKEQVQRLIEDKQFDISLACEELGFQPRCFATGIQEEVDLLRSKGILT